MDLAQKIMDRYADLEGDYNDMRDAYMNNLLIDNVISGIQSEVEATFNISEIIDSQINERIAQGIVRILLN